MIRAGQQAEEKLEEWLYGDQSIIQSNSQSKFLTGSMNIKYFNENINVNVNIKGGKTERKKQKSCILAPP